MNKTLFLPASTREHHDFGFMTAHNSFRDHLPPERKNLGVLITIDDAIMKPGAKGFGLHPHHDVEVVTFIADGEVKHIDPNEPANTGTLKSKGIQLITAGTGIMHNEENHSDTAPLHALQIWFLPRSKGLAPAYSRKQVNLDSSQNSLVCLLSPDGSNDSLIIQQDVWLSYGNCTQASKVSCQPKLAENWSFVYMLDGEVEANKTRLQKGDGFGVMGDDEVLIEILDKAEFLLFDLPH